MNNTTCMIPQELWKNLGTPFSVAQYCSKPVKGLEIILVAKK